MQRIQKPSELPSGIRKVALAIGFFDGVHLGHQQVIRQTIADARQAEAASVVVTFDRHPTHVVAPHRVPPLIYPRFKRESVIASLGVGHLLELPFDDNFSQIPGREFIGQLVAGFHQITSICVGSAFTFGSRRSGNVSLLREYGAEFGFRVHGLSAVALDDEAVSSTRIRQAIEAGDLDHVGQMLGRPYELCGRVIRGDRLGTKLGFPTANIDHRGLVLPPHGVYAVHVTHGQDTHRGALNIGLRPTLSHPHPVVQTEVHLLDFDQDLYDREIEISFVEKLREEMKFPSLEALQRQIENDIGKARRLFENH